MLSFKLADIIQVPFGYLMDWLYTMSGNYGLALILFSILVQFILLPVSAKSKKSMMKMSRLTPRMQEIQRRYADDQQKQNEAIQAMYKEEGVSMGGGCLWSFIPLLILFPLYTVVREPITYMLHENAAVATQIVEIIKGLAPQLFSKNAFYNQMIAASHIVDFADAIKAQLPELSARTLAGVNFDFIGVDLGAVPQFNILNSAVWAWDWAHIGGALLALLSAANQVLSMKVMQAANDSVVTNKDGVQDAAAAENSVSAQTNKTMMYTMPLMMLWIGFTVPAALSLYWLVSGLVRTAQDVVLTKRYRKIYDAEDAERLKRRLEQDKIDAEKERLRAERRAANPDGITSNTSKKKLNRQQRELEQAEKDAAAKEYLLKKGIAPAEEPQKQVMSGIADRPYCKGRNYNPNRYHNTEE